MKSYNLFERNLAKILDRFPQLKQITKTTYQHLNYWGYGDRYYLINIVTGDRKVIGKGMLDVYGDGHPSFSPDRRWILTDTYPDKSRKQHLLLYEIATRKLIEIGSFLAPLKYSNAKRCDLHPRWSPDGKYISIDSTYQGQRMTYILDVNAIIN